MIGDAMKTLSLEDEVRRANAVDDVRVYAPLVASGHATPEQVARLRRANDVLVESARSAGGESRPSWLRRFVRRYSQAWNACGSERTTLQNLQDMVILSFGSMIFTCGPLVLIIGLIYLAKAIV